MSRVALVLLVSLAAVSRADLDSAAGQPLEQLRLAWLTSLERLPGSDDR